MSDAFVSDIGRLLSSNSEGYSATGSIVDGTLQSKSFTGNRDANIFQSDNELDKMDFLKLLVTQLQYQDPLEPMDNTEFVAQLAQFSALEGTNNVADSISALEKSFSNSLDIQNMTALSMNNASAISLIGKEVRLKETELNYILEDDISINVHLGDNSSAIVEIYNVDGDLIRTIDAGNKDSENSTVVFWDGLTDENKPAKSGKYYVRVQGEESDTSLYCFVEDIIEGIRYTAEGPKVKIGGKEISMGSILDISMTKDSATAGGSISNETALSLIDKTVRYELNEVTYSAANGQTVTIKADLGGYNTTKAEIVDADGIVQQTITLTAEDGGVAIAEIPCTNFNNNGPYTVRLIGNNSAYLFGEGTVNGITTQNGIIKLRVNGITITLSEILDISSAI